MWMFYIFAIASGVASAIEPGQNAEMAKSFARPLAAGLVSLGISALTILLVAVATGQTALPSWGQLTEAPWWAWLGGVLSAGLALAQLFVSKRIGAAPFLGIIVTAGVVTSIGLDHFGLVGFERHPADVMRVTGGVLMVAGVGLIARF